VIADCIITDNRGSVGGGISMVNSNALTIEDSWLHRNVATYCGGAIGKFGGSNNPGPFVIHNSRFTLNRAPQGGAIFLYNAGGQSTLYQISNSIFDRNSAVNPNGLAIGGAIVTSGGPASSISNSVFYGNSAPTGFIGGVLVTLNHGRIYNNIFAGNIDRLGLRSGSQHQSGNAPNAPNSVNLFDVYSATSGQSGAGVWHAIIADPMFVDPVGPDGVPGTQDDDFRLRAGSPAIDAGVVLPSVPTYPVPPAADLDGLPRIIDDPTRPNSPLVPASTAPIDLGPYEYQSDCNGNMVIDSLDIANDPSIDCDNDGIIDTCQPFADCNANAINDRCEIAAGTAQDCNHNGIPDACDIALGTSLDENDNGIPDECEPALIRVAAPGSLLGMSDAWTDALDDLQDALAIARSRPGPTEIWVAQGVYHPSGIDGTLADAFEIPEGVTLLGGFAGNESSTDQRDPSVYVTVLSGDRAANDVPLVSVPPTARPSDRTDNVLNVVRIPGMGTGVLLDGLTISGGFADGPRVAQGPLFFNTTGGGDNYYGGALPLLSTAVPRIINCRFIGNFALEGGAVTGGGVFERCSFEDNQANSRGGAVIAYRNIQLIDCSFIGNSTLAPNATGGALELQYSLRPAQEILVRRCRFVANSAPRLGGAIAAYAMDSTIIDNSFFTGNTAQSGSAIQYFTGSPSEAGLRGIRLNNSTIVGNSASTAGGSAVQVAFGTPVQTGALANSILWGNTDSLGEMTFFTQVRGVNWERLVHNCIQGYESGGGPGNIGLDPRFLDLNGPDGIPGTIDDNPALAARSPCIDAGANHAVPTGSTTDLLGSPRFIDDPNTIDTGAGSAPIVDIGAAEYLPPFLVCPGDANGDNLINAADLSVFLFMFGAAAPPGAAADFNADGIIDGADLAILLARFGDAC